MSLSSGRLQHASASRALLGLVLATGILIAVTGGLNSKGLSILTLIAIWTVCGLSQTIAMGIGGIVTFGQAAFCALGAFGYAYLVVDRGAPLTVGVAGSGLAVMIVAALCGVAILKLRGYVLSIGTLGIFLAVSNLLPNMTWLSGGFGGRAIPQLTADPRRQAWIYGAIALLCLTAVHVLFRTRWGRRVVAIRDDETAAVSVGVPVFRTNLLVFVLAAGVAALGGIMYAAQVGYTSGDAFGLPFLTAMFVVAVVGGLRWSWGPLAGAAVYVLLQEYTVDLGDNAALVYALVFLGVILVMPGGAFQLPSEASALISTRRRPVVADNQVTASEESAAAVAGTVEPAVLRNGAK